MTRYFDQPTQQCEYCALRQRDHFPDGTPYWACRGYGYILHYDKPVTDEHCERRASQEEVERQQRANSLREMQRQARKRKK